MGFNAEQQLQIKNYFESGKYGIIARTAGLRKDKNGHLLDASGQLTTETGQPPSFCVDWHMVTEPEWRWEKYEYRAYAVVNTAPDTEWIDPLFVFGGSYISTWTSCLPGEQGTMVPLMSLPSTVMRLTPFSLPSGFFITMWYSPPRNLRTTSYSLAVLGRQGSMRRPS